MKTAHPRNPIRFALALAGLATSLQACDSGGSSPAIGMPDLAPPWPTQNSTDAPQPVEPDPVPAPLNCFAFEKGDLQTRIDALPQDLAAYQVSLPASSWCTQNGNLLKEGSDQIDVFVPFKLAEAPTVASDSVAGTRLISLRLGYSDLSADVSGRLIQALAIHPERASLPDAVQIWKPSFTFAILPDGEFGTVETGWSSSAREIRVLISAYVTDQAVSDFTSRQGKITLFAPFDDALTGHHAVIAYELDAIPGQSTRPAKRSVLDLARRMWAGAEAQPSGLARANQEVTAMSTLVVLLRDAAFAPEEIRAGLADAVQAASSTWQGDPLAASASPLAAELALKELELAYLAHPEDARVAAYHSAFLMIEPYLDAIDGPDAIREIVDLVQSRESADHEALFRKTAASLANAGAREGLAAWREARRIVVRAAYQAGTVDTLVDTLDWLVGPGPFTDANLALQTAERYVFDRRLDRPKLEFFRSVYAWLIGPGPFSSGTDTLSQTESYVFDSGLSAEQFDLLRSAYAWLIGPGPDSSSQDTLARANGWVLQRRMSEEQLRLLESAYTWLAGTGPLNASDSTLDRVESDLFDRRMDAAMLSRIKTLYSRYRATMPDMDALTRAEDETLAPAPAPAPSPAH